MVTPHEKWLRHKIKVNEKNPEDSGGHGFQSLSLMSTDTSPETLGPFSVLWNILCVQREK